MMRVRVVGFLVRFLTIMRGCSLGVMGFVIWVIDLLMIMRGGMTGMILAVLGVMRLLSAEVTLRGSIC